VLILLYPHRDRLHLVLTRRSQRLAKHRGQISLPGGAREAGDPDLWHTALREAEEEVNLSPAEVRCEAELSRLYIPASHFEVHPFVGYNALRPDFVANQREVAEVIEMPLAVLLDPQAKREEDWVWKGREMVVPFYQYGRHVIWGATAMILSELQVLLEREGRGR
jgi:8-oxo-dGTP pyrophosphatase MutT (NUDIX family)